MWGVRCCFLLFLAVITLNSNISMTAAPMSGSSKLKVAKGAIVSGAIGGGIAALWSKYLCEWDLRWKRSIVFCSLSTLISSCIGGHISYFHFTPEGQVSNAEKTVRSVDVELLHLIKTSPDNDQFYGKIKFYYSKSSFPTIVAFEYLDKKRSELLWAQEILRKLLKKIVEYPHSEHEIVDLLDSIDTMIPMIEKGIDIIKSDPSFDTKWQAYMLEKRLRAMQQELSYMRWQMFCNSLPSTNVHYHYVR